MKDISTYINESLFDKDLAKNAANIKIDPTSINNREEVVIYAMSLPYEFKEEKSGVRDKEAYAFSINYNSHLSLYMDFVTPTEFIYEWRENGKSFYDVNSTREIDSVKDWSILFIPEKRVKEFRRVAKILEKSKNKKLSDWFKIQAERSKAAANKIESLL